MILLYTSTKHNKCSLCYNFTLHIYLPDYNKTHLNHLILTQWINTTHVIILIPLHSYYSTIAVQLLI